MEYLQPYFSFTEFSPYVEDSFSREYPFSVSPDHLLNDTEIFSIFRDHYEGTVFDLTTGIAAGPYGDPYRIRGEFDSHTDFKDGEIRPGAWPRPISAYYCAYSYVTESRREMSYPVGGLCWFGFAQPSESCYTPLYVGTNALPESFENGNRSQYNRNSAWWSFNFVTNWARLQYSYIFPEIKEEQQKHENLFLLRQAEIEEEALEILNREGEDACKEYLTSYTVDTAEDLVSSWWNLSDSLVVSYTNGGIYDPVSKNTAYPGYPDWWYQDAGYQYGPRIYDMNGLDSTPDLVYVNETVYTTPGSEYEYILEHQTAENCS